MPFSSLVRPLAPPQVARAGPLTLYPSLRVLLSPGRTHRSNQVSAPEYVFLISELAGERRFASIVAKRLESLVSRQGLRQGFAGQNLARWGLGWRGDAGT